MDYNRTREKTFSQKMREADLMDEIAGISAKKKMITGKKDPTLILGEGQTTNAMHGKLRR